MLRKISLLVTFSVLFYSSRTQFLEVDQVERRPAGISESHTCIAQTLNYLRGAISFDDNALNSLMLKLERGESLKADTLSRLRPELVKVREGFDQFIENLEKINPASAKGYLHFNIKRKATIIKEILDDIDNGYLTFRDRDRVREIFSIIYPDYYLKKNSSGKLIDALGVSLDRYRRPKKLINSAQIQSLAGIVDVDAKYIGNIKHDGKFWTLVIPENVKVRKTQLQKVKLNKKLPIYHGQIVLEFDSPIRIYSQENSNVFEEVSEFTLSTYGARANGVKYSPMRGLISKDYALVNMIETRSSNNLRYINSGLPIESSDLKLSRLEMNDLLDAFIERSEKRNGNASYNTAFRSCLTEVYALLDDVSSRSFRLPSIPILLELQLRLRGLL